MALLTLRTDDLNGDADATTVVITVNGKGVEIDLAERSSMALTKALAPYWAVGTESDFDVVRRDRPRATKGKAKAKSNGHVEPSNAEIRAWAAANGVEVGDRGRIPQAVRDQYARSI